ncbi:MAG: M12 family metallo-peptidase, partial [Gammaproteobacteria bacterium]|nr:M12 family metallo-peptidase [Gammaproteobacteria bacterium]
MALTAALTSLCLVIASPAWAGHVDHDDGSGDLFIQSGAIADRSLPPQAVAGSGRLLSLRNADGLRDHSWSVTLPGVGRLIAERRQQRISGDGRTVIWIGSLRGAAGGLISVTERDGTISGFIDDGNRYWVIETAAQGLYRVYEIDTKLTPPPAAPVGRANQPTSEEATAPSTQTEGATVIQELLVAYSPEVTARYGGVAATETAIANHVAAVNQTYVNSQVDIQLNLVGTIELSQSQSGNMSTTLSRLRSTTDGFYDEVHPLRDQLQADLVAMLTTETTYCGMAYLNNPQFAGEDAWAFSVTSANAGYACLPLTFAHEFGHNQGLCHNREETGCTSPAYAYGFGYRVCGTFQTIMSYSCNNESRIYSFANPAVSHAGIPTGIAHADDPQNSSEAWRALNDSALDVADWRGCSALDAPPRPTALSAKDASDVLIDVSWVDNSTDEAGFDLERLGDDGQTWIKIASLGANSGAGGSVTYSDRGLASETNYSYRVYAHNCMGASAYDGPASATTQSPPSEPPLAPSAISATVDGNGIDTV